MSEFVIDIKTVEQFDNFVEDNNGVVVRFTADWCSPCRKFAPHFDKVAENDSGFVRFAVVDIEAVPALAERYNIRSIPAVLAVDSTGVLGYIEARSAVPLAREIDELF